MLIAAFHLPHISTLSLCTCLLLRTLWFLNHPCSTLTATDKSCLSHHGGFLFSIKTHSGLPSLPLFHLFLLMLTQPYNAATLNVLYCFIFLHKRILRQGKRLTVFAMMCTNTPCKHLQTHTHTHQHRLHACTDKQPYKLQEAHTKRERCMSGILSQNCRSDMVKYTQEFNLTEKHLKQQACQLTDD